MNINFSDARIRAKQVHYGQMDSGLPGRHVADGLVQDLLFDALVNPHGATRSAQSSLETSRGLWDNKADDRLADHLNKIYTEDNSSPEEGTLEARLAEAEFVQYADQYTAERVRNMKQEVLSRFVVGLIAPQTNIVNNFFTTIRADGAESIGQLREFVSVVEAYSDWEYFQIDPNRGDIPSLETNFTQISERINPQMAMYGVKIEYENFLNRVLQNTHIAEVLAMMTVGWSKASAMQREHDASKFLTNYLAPGIAFDNNDAGASALGQLSGVAINGTQNGTFDLDHDFPHLLDYMENDLQMSTDNLIMLLPRNAWPFMNMRKGYRRFLGLDGAPLYQRPQFTAGPKPALADDDRYGIRIKGVGFTPQSGAKYLTGTRQGNAAQTANSMVPGPMPFLPESVPNWMNTFVLPNAAFSNMRVVLTPFEQAQHKYYADGHALRNDAFSGNPRAIMTSDMLFFDGNHPMFLIESIPPTSWTASNDEYRTSTAVMVEAYAMANSARGQQACVVKGAVLDDNYTHEIRLQAETIKIGDVPLSGGAGNPGGLVSQ